MRQIHGQILNKISKNKHKGTLRVIKNNLSFIMIHNGTL